MKIASKIKTKLAGKINSHNNTYNFEIPKQFRRDKVLFIHVPKCAGSSFLNSYLGYQLGHTSASDYFYRDPVFFQEAFVFSFVRHPITRFISAYFFLQSTNLWKSYVPDIREKINSQFSSIDELARSISVDSEIYQLPWFRSQHSFLEVEGRLAVNKLFKTESFDESLSLIKSETGATFQNVESVNKSSKNTKDYQQLLSIEAIKNLEEIYDRDLTLFGYF